MALLTHVTPTGTETWDVDPISFLTLALTFTGAYGLWSWVRSKFHGKVR